MAEKFLAKAHHAYSKAKADELDLSPGDIIRVTNDEHSSWWVGHNQMTNEQGWFPSNFVDRVKASSSSGGKPPGSKPKLKATRAVRIIKAYEAIDEDDLSLQVGDRVEVTKEVDGWFLGTLDGQSGMFPVSHAEEIPADDQAGRRPLPPTPGTSARRGTVSSNAPGASLPQPPASSSSPQQQQQQPQSSVPPALPSRNPPLPPRASTDVGRMSFAEENAEEARKDKKSGHRISRLFGTKKHKNKDKEAGEPTAEQLDPVSARSMASAADEPPHRNDEESDEDMVSPALPSRPLPQPNISGAAGMTSPPPAARALPPIPGASSAAKAPLPPVPAAAPPVPAAAPPVPAAAPPVPSSVERRPSTASQQSTGPAPGAPLPPSVSRSATLAEEASDAGAEPAIAEENENAGDEDAVEKADDEAAEDAPAKVRGPAKLAKIVSDYEATSSEELNLMSGDVVTIITRGTPDEPRWKGEYHGKKGYFPAHVVEEIEESGELDEDAEDAAAKPKGFKLAAYGVQQGGLGSLFAGSGMPALRKTTPRKTNESDDSAEAPAPAAAPAIPKLRSVQRPPMKDEQPKEEQQQPNFLAHLSRVPRRSAPSDESPSPAPMAAVPMLPISRKSTANSNLAQEPEGDKKRADDAGDVVESAREPEIERSEDAEPKQPEDSADIVDAEDDSNVPDTAADTVETDASVPAEQPSAAGDLDREPELDDEAKPLDQPADDIDAEEAEGAEVSSISSGKSSALDPVKSPALAQGGKRVLRRGPRQKPTAEGLKRGSEESQSQQLKSALQKDKDAPVEAEPEPVRATPPPPPEKPKGLARHGGPYGGPQLPTGGFKAAGRVGSAMASRLAALQARASGNADEEGAEEPSAAAPTPRSGSSSWSPPQPQPSVDPTPIAKKPSYTARSSASPVAPAPASSVPSEWQKQVDDEHARLRGDLDRLQRTSEQHTDQLMAKLAAGERENQAHRQTIAALDGQVQTATAQLAALKAELAKVHQAVASVGQQQKQLTAEDVAAIVRSEIKSALAPVGLKNQELADENKKLHKMVADLRAYVDELVVDEEP
ncbi:hypothetical protein LPJ53_000568 [Coemansia erecta]|uniref:SH3 domain-containing protein n=1 Tax=Coemansia erecta TaxID=147472 RepID=A0A9W7Y7A2_9FUNG|nr:hypothetical protein LPJ53_000568 [Coemansia erecta]